MFDIVIEGARIVDGTGNPWFKQDIGLRNGRIERLGNLSSLGRTRSIDAQGLIVSPGFIDVHSHSDFSLVMNPPAESEVAQGITTEVTGNCGYSAFPLNEQSRGLLIDPKGVDNHWSTLDDYQDILQSQGTGTNVVLLVGHSTLRAALVGREDRAPTQAEFEQMKGLLREAIEAGSAGLSAGLEYEPGKFAETRELIALCRAIAPLGGIYASHIRGMYGDTLLDALEEALRVGREADLPVQLSHMSIPRTDQFGAQEVLERIESARSEGTDVTMDLLSYPTIGAWWGLRAILPEWAYDYRTNDTEALQAMINDPTSRTRLAREIEERREMNKTGFFERAIRFSSWDHIIVHAVFDQSEMREHVGRSIEEIAQLKDRDAVDIFLDLVLQLGDQLVLIHQLPSAEGHEELVRSPLAMFGTDSIATAPHLADSLFNVLQAHPRHYGTFAHVLGELVRERKLMSLPEAIRRCTSLPARRFGLADRGYVKEGLAADLVIFDQSVIGQRANFLNPRLYPRGIEYVLVNGHVAVEKGRLTKNLAGRVLLRRG
jgi:N-acyl-D-amino-acid deacylase